MYNGDTIYHSARVLPYVYMGTHKTTGQFYIGYRYANKKPAEEDLGTFYFTSSRKIKKFKFDNFDWVILAEFFDQDDAYGFEQDLIKEHWENPLRLNGYYHNKKDGVRRFTNLGKTKETDVGVASMAAKMTGRRKETHSGVAAQAAKMAGRTKETDVGVANMAAKLTGRTKENDAGMAASAKSRTGRTKGTCSKKAAQTEKQMILKPEQRKLVVQMKDTGTLFREIHRHFVDVYKIQISYHAVRQTYHREVKLLGG